jgi:hypothetical protein
VRKRWAAPSGMMSEKGLASISIPISHLGCCLSPSPTMLIAMIFHFFFTKIILNDACDKYAVFKPFRNIKGFTAQCLTDSINPFHTEIFRRIAVVGV